MLTELTSEREAIAELCRRFGVRRLTVFGSAVTDDFDPLTSDVDFIVEFEPSAAPSRFDAYFGLKDALEGLFGRPVDLLSPSAMDNPYFALSAGLTHEDLYAA